MLEKEGGIERGRLYLERKSETRAGDFGERGGRAFDMP